MLEFTLPYGIHVDVIALAQPLAPFRPYFAAVVYVGLAISLVGIIKDLIGMAAKAENEAQIKTNNGLW